MTVGIISGREGVGKTTQLLTLAKAYPKTMWIGLELKDTHRIKAEANKDFELCTAYKTYPKDHKQAMQIDHIATLKAVSHARDRVLKTCPETVVIDGISDLRDFATNGWAKEYNEANGTHLTTPKYKDWGEWGVINQKVRDILEPLINFALINDTNLWMTAQMKDDYVNDVKVGTKPDLKEWMSYPVQALFILSRNKDGYKIQCEKEPENASWSIENIEKDKGLLKALLEHRLVDKNDNAEEMAAEEKEYMIRYTENNKRKRMTVIATSAEKASDKFILNTEGKIEKYEVLE